MSKRTFGLFSLMVFGLFILAACADPQQPTATSVVFVPTPGGVAPTVTPSGTTVSPQPTSPSGPDAAAGQVTFATNCTACHSTDSTTLVGPGLGGVAAMAGSRQPGLSADEYLTMSITDPASFVLDGFPPIMPQFAQLTPQDVDNLVAYLKTLQ